MQQTTEWNGKDSPNNWSSVPHGGQQRQGTRYKEDRCYTLLIILQACAMSSKTTQAIISAVLKHWIAQFGPPMQMLTDNGGEFASDDFREMGEKLNTKILTTAAESPWSNGSMRGTTEF